MTKAPAIRPDPRNANKGTQRGEGMLERSLQSYGAGRSVLIDKNGVLIAGNKTWQKAQELGIPTKVVETDGHTLIAVQRTDLDLETDTAAMALGVVDNRASQVGLDWDIPNLQQVFDAGVDGAEFWFPEELSALLADRPSDDEWGDALGVLPDGDKAPFQQMTFTLHDTQAEQVNAAIDAARKMGPFIDSPNENSNGNALARICETFLTVVGRG